MLKRSYSWRVGAPILLSLVVAVGACRTQTPKEDLVATVNGEGITKTQFGAMVDRSMARYKSNGHTLPPGIEQRIKESVLRRMIDDKVIALSAKKEGVSVPAAELTKKFDDHKKRFRTEEAFASYLKRSNNTEESMKADLERNMLRDKVVEKLSGNVEILPADVQKYYDDNRVRFVQKEQIRAARILVRVKVEAPQAEWKAAEKKIKSLHKQVLKAGAEFGAIAKENSEGPEKSRNGELGWMTKNRMPPSFDKVAFALKPNAVSAPVKTRLGWEIIKVFEKREEKQQPLEEVKENIERSLTARKKNEKRREVLRTLKKEAKVEELIKFERPTNPIPPRAPPATGLKKPALPFSQLPKAGALKDGTAKAPVAPSVPAKGKPTPAPAQ